MAPPAHQLSWPLLKSVSRSFYWTLRVLPRAVRPQIALAYLLARTTDTIADTELVPLDRRLEALQRLREHIRGTGRAPLEFGDLVKQQGSLSERQVLQAAETNLESLQHLEHDREHVRQVLEIITSGQESDLRRFAAASAGKIVALGTIEELDDYTFKVAGCVGEFWTRVCRARLFPEATLEEASLIQDGVRFGKGLQLVNILRDLPADLRNGRCYLPANELKRAGLAPSDLLEPANEPRLRAIYDPLLDLAEAHLRAGWNYANTIPRHCVRVRLACAWPILIGMETIKLLRTHNVLEPQRRIKLDRRSVKRLMLRSILLYPRHRAWRNLIPARESIASKGIFA
jgi:farnesyl-diphosphate farnesyltransferase